MKSFDNIKDTGGNDIRNIFFQETSLKDDSDSSF